MSTPKIFTAILFLFLLFSGCETASNIGQFDSLVIDSEANQNKFSQLTFTLSLTNANNDFLVIPEIDSISLRVNGKKWGVFSSEKIDTASKISYTSDNLTYSTHKTGYLIIAPYILDTENLETAGEFVDYLNNRVVLTPGEYVCEISEIKFRNSTHEWIAIKPQAYKDFSVIENTTSSFLGDITLSIN